jgi:tRNA pseudouridine38-40 synthase
MIEDLPDRDDRVSTAVNDRGYRGAVRESALVTHKVVGMPRYKLTIEYDGALYSGWQRQENGRSIQQALEQAFGRLTGATPHVAGAGRTDAGVHARGQVAHVDLMRDWDGWRLREAINAHLLGERISVVEAEGVGDDFDARRSAIRRHYRYVVINRRPPLVFERGRAWLVKKSLNESAMREAAQVLIGRHDFSTFRDSQCQANSPLRTLDYFDVGRSGEQIRFDVGARSFLHRQVRSMVGSLAEVGVGKWSMQDFRAAFEAADRQRCGPVAPPDGLYLERVEYPLEA